MKLQEVELKIEDAKDGVFAISLVENPAIEKDFIALSSDVIELKVIDEERQIVVGFALVPDKRIYRRVQDKEFNIYFSADTIRQAQELFMKQLNLKNFTLEHETETDGVSVIESWIVEDATNDKSNLYNLQPKGGEWVVMSKIDNPSVWEQVKKGTYKGYSIEAMFSGLEKLGLSKDEEIINQLINIINGKDK